MSYVLFHRRSQGTPAILKRYDTLAAAFRGLRASNRNAGWTRIGRDHQDGVHTEFCAKANGLPVYDLGPYAVMEYSAFRARFGLDDMVPVVNLMSGETVLIRREDRGGCTDPSTEQYWSM